MGYQITATCDVCGTTMGECASARIIELREELTAQGCIEQRDVGALYCGTCSDKIRRRVKAMERREAAGAYAGMAERRAG